MLFFAYGDAEITYTGIYLVKKNFESSNILTCLDPLSNTIFTYGFMKRHCNDPTSSTWTFFF